MLFLAFDSFLLHVLLSIVVANIIHATNDDDGDDKIYNVLAKYSFGRRDGPDRTRLFRASKSLYK